MKPFAFSIGGFSLGIVAVLVWVFTFEPHGNVELSGVLFPGVQPVLTWAFPNGDTPMSWFFAMAVAHWLIPGVLIDLIRLTLSISTASRHPR